MEYIKSSFEYKNMKCHLSEFYIKIVNDMVNQILHSQPWKRIWIDTWINDKWWTYDYTMTQRSTFPDWAKFFFEKYKYTKNIKLWEILENWKILLEKWYNWNSKEFRAILKKSLIKPLTERQWNALEEAFNNFFEYIEEFEHINWEKYFFDEINEYICRIYDENGILII